MLQGWDIEKLRDSCAENGMVWQFITPAAPHQNGCTESWVESRKYALKKAIREQILSRTVYMSFGDSKPGQSATYRPVAFQTIRMTVRTYVPMTCYSVAFLLKSVRPIQSNQESKRSCGVYTGNYRFIFGQMMFFSHLSQERNGV